MAELSGGRSILSEHSGGKFFPIDPVYDQYNDNRPLMRGITLQRISICAGIHGCQNTDVSCIAIRTSSFRRQKSGIRRRVNSGSVQWFR